MDMHYVLFRTALVHISVHILHTGSLSALYRQNLDTGVDTGRQGGLSNWQMRSLPRIEQLAQLKSGDYMSMLCWSMSGNEVAPRFAMNICG